MPAVHRHGLLRILERYLEQHPDELVAVDHIRQFVRVHEDCFERSCLEGHITGSAWIVSPDHRSVLLHHHAKLDKWLQLGGHSDGDPDPFRVALREAREESGMATFREPSGEAVPTPLDVDVHRIPERGVDPAHLHLDVRYLLVAAPGQGLVRTEESKDLRWIPVGEIPSLTREESVLRLARKAMPRLRAGVVRPVDGSL